MKPCRVDAGTRFGDAELDRCQLRHLAIAAGDRAAGGAHLGHVEKGRKRTFRHAEHRRHDGDRQHGEERLFVERIGARPHAGRGGGDQLGKGQRAMARHESVFGDDGFAPRSGQAHRPPVIVDSDVGGAQREKSRQRRAARLRDHAAEKLPLRVVAAAAETARAGNAIAAIDRDRLRHRRVGTGRERVTVVPDFVLCFLGEARQQPLLRSQQAIHPAGRTAAAGDHGFDLGEDVEAVFEAAISLRLHDAEQIRLPHARDHVVGDAARRFGFLRPFARDARRYRAPAPKVRKRQA